MSNKIITGLALLFEQWSGHQPETVEPLAASGSDRQYYRLSTGNKVALGVHNSDAKENLAFVEFSKHFLKHHLPVPEIYAEDLKNNLYLLQDFGDETLYAYLINQRKVNGGFPADLLNMYKRVIDAMPSFQIKAAKDFNYSLCYPRAAFDKQSMMWDMSYFKYYFLKLAKIPFDEQALEDDFQTFTDYLLQADTDYFLYRDFQSRNIMVVNDKPYFIDYQGGRKGALQYDLASLLYDAKADIPQPVREELLAYYLEVLSQHIAVDKKKFTEYYHAYVLVRIMQALGAYGFRGFYEKKEHFLLSIPYALENLRYLLANVKLPIQVPALMAALKNLTESELLKTYGKKQGDLHVTVMSFAYPNGLPQDDSGNGGGFVFDCRAIHNPGRYDEYKKLTGRDEPVITFFKKDGEIDKFLQNVFPLVDRSVDTYLERNFSNLMVNFGCTGGQHRSVYSADKLVEHLREKYKINITLIHREQNIQEELKA